MQVKKTPPVPQKDTYDLLGLTDEEICVIRNALFSYQEHGISRDQILADSGKTQGKIASELQIQIPFPNTVRTAGWNR